MWQVCLRAVCMHLPLHWTKGVHAVVKLHCMLLQVGDDTGGSTKELTGHTDTVSLLPSLMHVDNP